jgi:hypothetical protein
MKGSGNYQTENFSQVKWGAFTKEFEKYKKDHPENKALNTLKDFAHFILQYPSTFNKTSKKRATFYVNVLSHKKLSNDKHIMGRRRKGGDLLDDIKGGLEKAGEPFKAVTGVNPATLGYDFGKEVLGPLIAGGGLHIHHHHHHHHSSGEGILDDIKGRAKQIGKVVLPVAIAEGKKHLKELAPEIIKTGASHLKKMAKNNELANTLIDKGAEMANKHIEGLGVKKPARFVKGSQEAKDFMAKLRSMRKK